MNSQLSRSFICLLVLFCGFALLVEAKINYAYIVTRHGIRSPSRYFNNTPIWKEGAGGLTEKGALDLYEFGYRMRKRYTEEENLLSQDFIGLETFPHLGEMSIKSPNISRIIDSAYYFVKGIIGKEHNSHPVQHYEGDDMDRMKFIENYGFKQFDVDVDLFNRGLRLTMCAKGLQNQAQIFKDQGGIAKVIQSKTPNDTLKYIEALTNKTRDELTITDLFYLCDFIECNRIEGILDKVQTNFSMDLNKLAKDLDWVISFSFFSAELGPKENLMMKMHFHLLAIADKIMNKSSRREKLTFESTHEGILYGFLKIFTDYKKVRGIGAPFGSGMTFEIFEKQNDPDEYIRLIFNEKLIPQPYCKDQIACTKKELIGHMRQYMFDNEEDFLKTCDNERLTRLYEVQKDLVALSRTIHNSPESLPNEALGKDTSPNPTMAIYASLACLNSIDIYDQKLEIMDYLQAIGNATYDPENIKVHSLSCVSLRRYFLDNKEVFMKKVKFLRDRQESLEKQLLGYKKDDDVHSKEYQ